MIWTGVGALAFGLVMVATTFNYVRRYHFNTFYWAHYSFVGFFVLAFLHAREAQPFLIVGIVVYALDKLLRLLWTLLPTRLVTPQ